MVPDINIRDYYNQYIYDAKYDINRYKEKIAGFKEIKSNLYKYLTDFVDILKEEFKLELKLEYDSVEYVYVRSTILANDNLEHPNRIVLLQFIKYLNVIKGIIKYEKLIILATKRKNLKYNDYAKYVTRYYNQVHKCVLDGFAYKFSYGIGYFLINYWKIHRESKKKYLDYDATNKRKRELLAKGAKLYDEKEAAWYKARGIPYDGIEYRIFKIAKDFYEITFINSELIKTSNLDYKHTEYIANKYRGKSYKELADEVCRRTSDIYDMQVDIKYKLNMLLHREPNSYLNFVRNADQSKYNNREDYS